MNLAVGGPVGHGSGVDGCGGDVGHGGSAHAGEGATCRFAAAESVDGPASEFLGRQEVQVEVDGVAQIRQHVNELQRESKERVAG